MESLSAGLYVWESVQILFFLGSVEVGPGRLTLGLEMSCCDAERVMLISIPPRRRMLPSEAEPGAGRAALALHTMAAATTAAQPMRVTR